jgi:hypothetical protein
MPANSQRLPTLNDDKLRLLRWDRQGPKNKKPQRTCLILNWRVGRLTLLFEKFTDDLAFEKILREA